MKYSKQRQMIIEAVSESKLHPTAEMIYEIVKQKIPHISLGTVYRNLNLLVSSHEIRRISFENGADRFDGRKHHDHFKCINCGLIFDIYSDHSIHIEEAITMKTGHEILSHETIFTGICNICKKLERGSEDEFKRNENRTKSDGCICRGKSSKK